MLHIHSERIKLFRTNLLIHLLIQKVALNLCSKFTHEFIFCIKMRIFLRTMTRVFVMFEHVKIMTHELMIFVMAKNFFHSIISYKLIIFYNPKQQTQVNIFSSHIAEAELKHCFRSCVFNVMSHSGHKDSSSVFNF